MAIKTIASIRTDLTTLLESAAEVTPADILRWLQDTLDSAGPVGGGIISARAIGDADGASQSFGTSPAKVTGAWTENMESRGIVSAFGNGRLTVGPGADGIYQVDWSLSFRTSTAGRSFLFAPRVTRGGTPAFETDARGEGTAVATGTTYHVTGTGAVVNLAENDFVELWCQASSGSSTMLMRQAQLRLVRLV